MPIIIVSNQDLASQTIKKKLIEIGHFEKTDQKFEGNIILEESNTKVPIVTTNHRLIEADHLSQHFKTDLFIFASKHKSESEMPSLLVHATGNWTEEATFGGNPYELSRTSASAIKQVLGDLVRIEGERQLNYDVTSEVTHHGPTNLEAPCIFIELGSNEKYWQDAKGAEVVAETIINLITRNKSNSNWKYAIGFGGPHYASHFNKVQLDSDYAVSHIAAKYVLDGITSELVEQAINKTVEDVKYAILDWKGMIKDQKDKIIEIAMSLGLKILRARKILKE